MRCPRCGYTTDEFETCPQCSSIFESGFETGGVIDLHTLPKAGFWVRFAAFVADILVILILSRIAGVAIDLGAITIDLPEDSTNSFKDAFGFYIFTLLIAFYFTFFIGWSGQTIGKMLLKIQVVTITGNPVGYGRAFLRYIGYHLCFMTVGLGFLIIVVDRNKRGLHDLIAGTCVVEVNER